MFSNFSRTLNTLFELQREMERAMNTDYFGSSTTFGAGYPAVNLFKKDDDLVLTAELPGIKKADIKLEVKNNLLRIAGKREVEYEKEVSVHRLERGNVEFDRTIRLPFNVDAEKVDAEYKDGILKLFLPRAESEKPKQLTIH